MALCDKRETLDSPAMIISLRMVRSGSERGQATPEMQPDGSSSHLGVGSRGEHVANQHWS